jgi:hypothetical protein
MLNSQCPVPGISFQNYTPLTREETIYALSAVFAINGISIMAAGDKLLLVVPAIQEDRFAKLLSRRGPVDYSLLTNTVPASTVNESYARLETFAGIYQQLAERKTEVGAGVRMINLGLKFQTGLSAGKALRALDLLFGVNGLRVTNRENSSDLVIIEERDSRR